MNVCDAKLTDVDGFSVKQHVIKARTPSLKERI